jgi:hypothetical protein
MSVSRFSISSFLLWFAVILGGCGSHRALGADNADNKAAVDAVPRSREADDIARFLTGLPGKPGSSFAALEESDAWKEHRRQLDAAWRTAEMGLLPGFRRFQAQELSDPALAGRVVFYPFSGPDVLTATLYFPHNPIYVLVALEPAGTLPAYRALAKKDLPEYLAAIRGTTASELGRSFFITKQMDHQFRGQVTDGLLLPILQLLVRTGHTVLGFRYVRLDENGQVIERAADYHAPTRYGNKGVEIQFQTDADSSLHTLYYFSVNLSNDRLRENKPFQIYLSRLTNTVSMMKATSYMPHQPGFSMIRNALLANSATILQDDSGIPYRDFQAGRWKVQLYGEYTKPYGSFRWLEQEDLREAYETSMPKQLPMHVGYGYRRIMSNLQLATRVR